MPRETPIIQWVERDEPLLRGLQTWHANQALLSPRNPRYPSRPGSSGSLENSAILLP